MPPESLAQTSANDTPHPASQQPDNNPLQSPTTKSKSRKMPRAVKGVLIECDPSVKAIILKYDEERHDYIVEDLDDERHLVIKESQLPHLKARLSQELDEKIMQPEESESE
ncbi:TFIIH complex subunit tfb5 [Emmonsiellopsis sp. PD_5]|nr:TFIIH complex subunit tfb5 [Emmonsiellopsis sp. PD_5]